MVDTGLLVPLEVGAGLKAFVAVRTEVWALPRVRVQVFAQVGRLFEPEIRFEYK